MKIASLVQSIAQGHPFHNGNKRTALACLHVFLLINGYESIWSSQQAEDFIVHIITNEEAKKWDWPTAAEITVVRTGVGALYGGMDRLHLVGHFSSGQVD